MGATLCRCAECVELGPMGWMLTLRAASAGSAGWSRRMPCGTPRRDGASRRSARRARLRTRQIRVARARSRDRRAAAAAASVRAVSMPNGRSATSLRQPEDMPHRRGTPRGPGAHRPDSAP
jgi:hypothetical protein